jgi:DNA-binding NarL/FixJ family response regulator
MRGWPRCRTGDNTSADAPAPPAAQVCDPGTVGSVFLTRRGRWLDLHASWLLGPSGQRRIAVVVEPAEPQASMTIVLAAHGLSPREQDVARFVLRGLSTTAIADALHISAHTVQDHLKAVFDKVGVRARRELVGLILAGSHRH